MPRFPHEYVVRGRTPRHLRDAYDRLFRDTLAHGYRARFGSVTHWYLNIDGWRYWSCTTRDCVATSRPCPHAGVGVGCVLNRDIDVPPAQLRLEVEDR
jgi:hypothetical protein